MGISIDISMSMVCVSNINIVTFLRATVVIVILSVIVVIIIVVLVILVIHTIVIRGQISSIITSMHYE